MKVYLNIYDLAKANYYLHSFGFGVYHTGIQVGSVEYHFGGHEGSSTGVCETDPKDYSSNVTFRETLFLGECTLTSQQVRNAMEDLKRDYPGNGYDVLARNCNHFSDAVSKKLLKKPLPNYVNRIAFFGNMMRCCLPASLTDGQSSDPTKQGGSNGGGSSSSSSMPSSRIDSKMNSNISPAYSFAAFKGSAVSIGGTAANNGGSKNTKESRKFNYLQQKDEVSP